MERSFPDTWKLLPLENCMAAIIDYRGKTPEKTSFGIPLITAKIVKGGRINEVQEYIAPEDYDTWMRRGLPKPGDIVMTTEAPLGEIAQLDGRKVALAQRLITLRGKAGLLDNSYLKFLMQSEFVQCQLHARATGTTVLGIKQSELRKIALAIPPLPEQKAIAHILGTLDDKIELNQQMNRNLKAIASAIFKSWFVDFDPVRAKMERRQPSGMDAATAALFPDSFEDSPIGEIPRGWKAVSLGDVITLYDSRRIPLSNRERAQRQGQYPYYGAASVMDYVDDYLFDGVYVLMGEDGSVVDDNDHPVIQYVWGKFWVNNHAHVLQGTNGVSNEHLMLFLKQTNIRPYVTGAVQPKLNQGNLRCIPFVLPSPKVCNAFGANVSCLYALFRANYDQSRSLATIRDTLLPKLMSGEIRVKEAEKILEDVA